MKPIVIGFAVVTASLSACSNNNSQSKEINTINNDTAKVYTEPISSGAKETTSLNELLAAYIQLKNALTNDNGKDAATAGKKVSEAILKIDEASFTPDQKKVFDDLKDDIKEHGEHIGSNGDKIAHQREHFEMLSKDMYDLIKAIGSNQTLYKDYCPMYNNGKGANWLSEVKEIKNPYLGKKMPHCGELKEEINK